MDQQRRRKNIRIVLAVLAGVLLVNDLIYFLRIEYGEDSIQVMAYLIFGVPILVFQTIGHGITRRIIENFSVAAIKKDRRINRPGADCISQSARSGSPEQQGQWSGSRQQSGRRQDIRPVRIIQYFHGFFLLLREASNTSCTSPNDEFPVFDPIHFLNVRQLQANSRRARRGIRVRHKYI